MTMLIYRGVFIQIIWQPRTPQERAEGWDGDYISPVIGPFRTEKDARKFAVAMCKKHKGSGTKPKSYPRWKWVQHVSPETADGWSVN